MLLTVLTIWVSCARAYYSRRSERTAAPECENAWEQSDRIVLNAPTSPVFLLRGGEMLLRAGFTTITILIGLAGPGSNGYAQSYSGRHYLPSQGIPRPPEQPAWYGEAEGDRGPDLGRAVRPESANSDRDAGITGSTRGEPGGFAGLPPK